MSTATRLLAFVAGLAVVFGLALAVGAWAGPLGGAADHAGEHDQAEHDHADHDHGGDAASGGEPGLPGGLQVSDRGYTLALRQSRFEPGTRPIAFTVDGPDGSAVTDFEVVHDKELHLIAVRRDLTGFQHVHPDRDAQGVWRVDLDLRPGVWRIFADFAASRADGEPTALTLGADLFVGGAPEWSAPLGEVTRTAEVDGFTVQQAGDLSAGHQSLLTFTVTRGGEPVPELEPYLGARGHLVALREGDLAYLHVHPSDLAATPGNQVSFAAGAPSAGKYRLFLDFQVAGTVHTAEFVLPASGGDR